MKPREFLALPEDWASLLDMRLLIAQADPIRKKAYICSPCRADTHNGVYGNMMAVRYYMYYVYMNMKKLPFAPHAYLPVMLNDQVESERSLALKFGKELLTIADEVLVCGHVLTDGMLGEIRRALELGITITVFSPALRAEIKERVGVTVNYDDRHVSLVLTAGELFEF
jgi:hypothetical protein